MHSNSAVLWLPAILLQSLCHGNDPGTASYNRSADPHGFTVFMTEGGWCWFQDPRAIIHDDKLFIGSVQGNSSGAALVGVYDLDRSKPLGTAIVHDDFDRDDHNSPVFHARPDGNVLAVYARHGRERVHYYRISDLRNPLEWSEEMTYRHEHHGAGNVTYMNLYAMSQEGKLYNFYRGIEFNPSFITSTDNGKTWGTPRHFIESELPGRHRPYARYAGNGIDTIHVSFTDGHPDRYGNHIYYAAFRDGNFHRADGRRIKSLKQDGPLKPSEAERIFTGSGKWAPPGRASAERSAWTSSIAIDRDGHPHVAYSLHLSNSDHRYRIASFNGTKWVDREVARAGHCLYDTQTSYTGLIALDQIDPTVVVISTNVEPTSGKDDGGKHEIYRAKVDLDDDIRTIAWKAVTTSSPVRNLRPVIVRDDKRRVVLWNRGEFISYTNYQLDTVGFVEDVR